MVQLYKTDVSGALKGFIASFPTETEALIYIQTHPTDFLNSIPKIVK